MELKSIVISLILEQRNLLCSNFLLWDSDIFTPSLVEQATKIPLVINLLNSKQRAGFEKKVQAVYDSTHSLKNCFSKLIFTYSSYDTESDSIIKDSNLRLFNILEAVKMFQGYTLLLDINCLWLRPNWLVKTSEFVSDLDCWVGGGIYRGISEVDKELVGSLNQNAFMR